MSRTRTDTPYSRLLCGETRYIAALLFSDLVTGTVDGALSVLLPVDEPVYKRLQLLQGQLTRNVQHVAGLNPKAFRFVNLSGRARSMRLITWQDGSERICIPAAHEGDPR
jgi:hypothetical protein